MLLDADKKGGGDCYGHYQIEHRNPMICLVGASWKQQGWAAFVLSYEAVSTWAFLATFFSWRHDNVAAVVVLITMILIDV